MPFVMIYKRSWSYPTKGLSLVLDVTRMTIPEDHYLIRIKK